ncbi:MAG TPA: hypothetical protein VGL23_07250 [Chloroflexota bacterium]
MRGQDDASPVWWVTVRGRFRFAGMAPAGTRTAPILAADERTFLYDARTGQLLGSRVPTRPAP